MSPDEEVIRQRGQIRTSPRKRAFQTSTPTITDVGKAMHIHTVLVHELMHVKLSMSIYLLLSWILVVVPYYQHRAAQLVPRWCIGSALSIGGSLIII